MIVDTWVQIIEKLSPTSNSLTQGFKPVYFITQLLQVLTF
jgi:hypothetical protein